MTRDPELLRQDFEDSASDLQALIDQAQAEIEHKASPWCWEDFWLSLTGVSFLAGFAAGWCLR